MNFQVLVWLRGPTSNIEEEIRQISASEVIKASDLKKALGTVVPASQGAIVIKNSINGTGKSPKQ